MDKKRRIMRWLVSVLFTVISVLTTPAPARADTPLDLLGVEKSMNDAARRAIETGDAIAQAFAEQALRVIAEWKKANEHSINMTFDRLDVQTRTLFTSMNNIATRIEKGEAVAFVDIQRTMVNAGAMLEKLPLADRQTSLVFYWPTVFVPREGRTVGVRAIGVRIGDANPRLKLGGKSIEVKKYGENEIGFEVERALLAVSKGEVAKTSLVLTYEGSPFAWTSPKTWFSDKERTIELSVLPRVAGTASLVQTVRREDWVSQEFGPFVVGGVGKDNIYRTGHALTPQQKEEGWIVDKAAQAGAKFDDNAGDGDGGSSCTGYDSARFTDTFVAFNIQHGHKNSGFGRSDAHQNCRVWLKLKRKLTRNEPLPPMVRELSWLSDTDFGLDPNMVSYDLSIKLTTTGRSYTIRSPDQVPYSLFEVMQDKSAIKVRPRQQREF